MAAAVGVFLWLGIGTHGQPRMVSVPWMIVLVTLSLAILAACAQAVETNAILVSLQILPMRGEHASLRGVAAAILLAVTSP